MRSLVGITDRTAAFKGFICGIGSAPILACFGVLEVSRRQDSEPLGNRDLPRVYGTGSQPPAAHESSSGRSFGHVRVIPHTVGCCRGLAKRPAHDSTGTSATITGFKLQQSYSGALAMLSLVITLLIIAVIAAVLGFGGIAGAAVGIAKIVFFVALVLFLISLIAGGLRGGFGRRL